jgi:hypothetical protein
MNSVKEEIITIDPTQFLGREHDRWQFPYNQFKTVQALLDTLYSALPLSQVRPYSYEIDWISRDQQMDKLFDIGSNSDYVKATNKRRDDRTLPDVGIKPTALLSIIKPNLSYDSYYSREPE